MAMSKKRQFAGNPDYMTQSEALEYLEMYHPTFNRYLNMLGIEGIHEGRCAYYKRSEIERLKSLKGNMFSRAVGIIERETGKKVKQIVFEDNF